MKPNDFENILQQAASDFSPTVSDELYNGLLQKQITEKRSKMRFAFFVFSSLLLITTIASVAYWINQPMEIAKKTIVANSTKQTEVKKSEKQHTKVTSVKSPKILPPKQTKASVKLIQTTTILAKINKPKNSPLANNPSTLLSIRTNTTNLFNKLNEPNILTTITPKATNQNISTSVLNNIAGDKDTITINTQQASDIIIVKTDSIIAPQNVLFEAKNDSHNNVIPIKPEHSTWGIILSGVVQPTSTIKNTVASLPPKFYDSLGLSENGRLGLGINLSASYQFNPHVSVSIGISYQQIMFDAIRAVNVSIDSTELVVANTKFYDVSNTQFLLDTKLGWLEFPLQLQYTFSPLKRLNSYVQGGVALQKMILQRGTSINQDAKGVATLTPIKNAELNRFNQTQYALLIETGLHYQLNKHLHFQLGIAYKQQLNNHYTSIYTKQQPGYYIGILPALKFIF